MCVKIGEGRLRDEIISNSAIPLLFNKKLGWLERNCPQILLQSFALVFPALMDWLLYWKK